MILTTLYSLCCALAIAADLLHRQWVAAFCVAVLCATSFIGGDELRSSLNESTIARKLGRFLTAVVLVAIALWLSHYRVNLIVAIVPGLAWTAIGIGLGVLTNAMNKRG